MIFSNYVLFRASICVLAFCGFFVARHIRQHKLKGKRLVCVARFDCHSVVNSDYSKFFGIPVELLGMTYYMLVFMSYLSFILMPSMYSDIWGMVMVALSASAFIFSVYLIGVQLFVLRKACSWCFISASISIFIFALSITNYDISAITRAFF